MFIDEVQDIPLFIIKYISYFFRERKFICGDNAQNIQKGVSIKFRDITEKMNDVHEDKFDFIQFTVNFRSQKKILSLANAVITSMELFFPDSIESLKKENSIVDGPFPVVIGQDEPPTTLVKFCIDYMGAVPEKNKPGVFNFGESTVFIVRDEGQKKLIPPELINIEMVTLQEAKGMEYSDVILFNYF